VGGDNGGDVEEFDGWRGKFEGRFRESTRDWFQSRDPRVESPLFVFRGIFQELRGVFRESRRISINLEEISRNLEKFPRNLHEFQ
jgi:hypothetical protein